MKAPNKAKSPKPPTQTTLYFAVIDGEDPGKWMLYGKRFSDLIEEASKAARPYGVPPQWKTLFSIDVKPLLISPDELLEEKNLDKVIGVIIDAQPNGAARDEFFDRKLFLLKQLYLKQTQDCDQPLFERFGYKVWFATDKTDSPETAMFIERVRDALEANIREASVTYDYIVEEGILSYLMMQVVHEAYFTLARGGK
jgi:hypothetical protein